MTADQIVNLLAAKHGEDVFVPECKDGPSQGCTHLRLDGWAMTRSWSRMTMYGYEVKVSRSDFVGDQKWTEYAPLCNQLYIVCPAKLVTSEEVKAICQHAGLIWAYPNRLHTRAKALHRQIDPPTDLLLYVLMCRTRVGREWESPQSQLDYWKAWLATRDEEKEIGHRCSKKLRELVHERIARVEAANKETQRVVEEFKKIRDFLKAQGIHEDRWASGAVERRFGELAAKVPMGLRATLGIAVRQIQGLQEAIDELTKPQETPTCE